MRRKLSRILCLMLAMALAGSLSITALAAEDTAPLFNLSAPATAVVGTEIEVLINVSEADLVADARLTVTYTSALTFSDAKIGSAWSNEQDVRIQANPQEAGEVSVAFAGVDAAAAGDVVKLTFITSGAGLASIGFDADNSYVTGVDDPTFGTSVSMAIISNYTPGSTPAATYNVTVVGGSGSGTYSVGDTVTITAAEHPGTFTGWTTEGAALDDPSSLTTTFVMPAHDVTVTANWELSAAEVADEFVDVDYAADSEYAEAIAYVVSSNIMLGTSETTFAPQSPMTRAMIVTMLYRMAGSPAVSAEIPFTDVAAGAYYSDAVAWAYANGIAKGTSETTFNPSGILTRQEIATFLYRYARLQGLDNGESGTLSQFTDAAGVSNWADEAMRWAVGSGLIHGTSDVTLSPVANATRIQMALIIYRFLEG